MFDIVSKVECFRSIDSNLERWLGRKDIVFGEWGGIEWWWVNLIDVWSMFSWNILWVLVDFANEVWLSCLEQAAAGIGIMKVCVVRRERRREKKYWGARWRRYLSERERSSRSGSSFFPTKGGSWLDRGVNWQRYVFSSFSSHVGIGGFRRLTRGRRKAWSGS